MSAKKPLFELKGLTKAFGGLHVVDHLDLYVGEGEIVSLIGPNGAGKTTVFNLVTGIYEPDSGEILSRARTSPGSRRTRSPSAGSRARSRRCGSS